MAEPVIPVGSLILGLDMDLTCTDANSVQVASFVGEVIWSCVRPSIATALLFPEALPNTW